MATNLALAGIILLCGWIFWMTHGDEDAYDPDENAPWVEGVIVNDDEQ